MNSDDIRTVGVAGLGLMGRGIAACFLSHGYRVFGFDPNPESRMQARAFLKDAMSELVERAGFPQSLRSSWPPQYRETAALDEFKPCDFVVETIVEDRQAKSRLFEQLEAIVRPDVPLASNTSAIPISSLQEGRAHPERIVGMHWLQPGHLTRFMEVIRGERTSDETMARTEALAWRLGKEPALVKKDVRGFIVNRLGYALFREALHLVEQGIADPETIERAWCNTAGWYAAIAGPFRMMDHNLPMFANVMEDLLPELSAAKEVPAPLRERIAAGHTGMQAGQGLYAYAPGEAEAWERRFREFMWEMRDLLEKHRPLEKERKA